ncbi:MAG: copper resistance protein CopC [Salinibacterium sp.]|nr:copper resistance protein CopC [Salinibacterium sp.]
MTITATRAAAFGALVVVASVLGFAAPAQAHNYLVSSTPSEGQTLTELPTEFSVTTNGPLLTIEGSITGFGLEIKGADGLYYGDGCVTVLGASISEKAALGPAGDYTMVWQLISEDGHTVSGEVNFSWAPDATFQPSEGTSAPATCGNSTAVPVASGPETTHGNADLGDVLWIGGTIGALLLVGFVTFLIVTRKKKA